jgi:hypothetical protein
MDTLPVYGREVHFDELKPYGLIMPGNGNGLDFATITDVKGMLGGIFSQPRADVYRTIGEILRDQEAALEFLPLPALDSQMLHVRNTVGLLGSVKEALEATDIGL